MVKKAVATFEYVRFDGENIKECKKLAGDKWYSNNPGYNNTKFYGIKMGKERVMLSKGDYLVKDYFGNIAIHSMHTFFKMFNPVSIGKSAPIPESFSMGESTPVLRHMTSKPWGFDLEPHGNHPMDNAILEIKEDLRKFDDLESAYPGSINITADHLKMDGEGRKVLKPDTIAKLIQSSLENNPDGYSMDALSRTMFNRK